MKSCMREPAAEAVRTYPASQSTAVDLGAARLLQRGRASPRAGCRGRSCRRASRSRRGAASTMATHVTAEWLRSTRCSARRLERARVVDATLAERPEVGGRVEAPPRATGRSCSRRRTSRRPNGRRGGGAPPAPWASEMQSEWSQWPPLTSSASRPRVGAREQRGLGERQVGREGPSRWTSPPPMSLASVGGWRAAARASCGRRRTGGGRRRGRATRAVPRRAAAQRCPHDDAAAAAPPPLALPPCSRKERDGGMGCGRRCGCAALTQSCCGVWPKLLICALIARTSTACGRGSRPRTSGRRTC